MPTTSWLQLQCILTDATGNTPYYLTANGTTDSSPVVLDSSALPQPGNLWLLSWSDGLPCRIRSQLNDGLVLGVGGNGNLLLQKEQLPPPPSQLWTINPLWDSSGNFNGAPGIGIYELGNAQSGYLAASPLGQPAADGMAVVAGQPSGLQSDPAYQWCFSPNPILQRIAELPSYNGSPTPSFPAFTGDQAIAYAYISSQLFPASGGDLRSMYTNPGESWSGYQLKVSNMTNGSGVSDADFAAVQAQIGNELLCLGNITTTFGLAQGLSAITGVANANVVSEASTLVALTVPDSQVGADVVNALETIGLAIISATGAPGTVVAGMLQAGIGLAVSLSVDSGGLGPPEPLAAAGLWQSITDAFTATLSAMGTQFNACQTDWGRMQICSALIGQKWPISLALDDMSAAQCATAAGTAMGVYALQTLMPAQWQVYECFPGQSPSSDATLYRTTTGRTCYLADVQNGTTFPTPALMAHIAKLGISLEDLYEGNNGWTLAQTMFGGEPSIVSGNEPLSHNLRITVANATPNPIVATIWLTDDSYAPQSQVFSATVIPGASMWGPSYDDDTCYQVQLTDAVYGNGAPFATINLKMNQTFLAGGEVTLQQPAYASQNSTVAYTIPITYGWEAGAVITNGGIYSGSAVIKVSLA